MSDLVLSLVTGFGAYVIFASAFLSCLALPIPTSLMMLSGGAFVATGDLSLWTVVLAAYAGAVLGDQTGYMLARWGGAPLLAHLARAPARRAALDRARALVERRGAVGVFFSTWLLAPLGPWVNFVAGATGFSWARFALWDILGEVIWVTTYVGLGYAFSSSIGTVADVMGNIVGLLVAVTVAIAMGLWIRTILRQQRRARAP